MKTIAAVILGQDGSNAQTREVDLSAGSTPRDLLVALGIPPGQYGVARENSSQLYADDEPSFFSDVSDGDKVRIVPLATVGKLTAGRIG